MNLSKLCQQIEITHKVGAHKPFSEQSEWQQKSHPYHVYLTYQGRTIDLDYWMGWLNHEPPDSASVISSLLLDSVALDNSFEEFCGEFGYDTDSRRAEHLYNSCRELGEKLKTLLGEDFSLFQNAENDV